MDGTSIFSSTNNSVLYPLGSTTKLFTSLLMMAAIEDNRLYPQACVRDLLGPIQSKMDLATMEQLAAHTSGLPRDPPCTNGNCSLPTSAMLARLAAITIPNVAASAPLYSNLGAALLGHSVAAAFGDADAYEDQLLALVAHPLGMQGAAFQGAEGWDSPSSGLSAQGADMTAFLEWVTSPADTRLLSAESKRSWMELRAVLRDGSSGYGVGWGAFHDDDVNAWCFEASGMQEQASSQVRPVARVGHVPGDVCAARSTICPTSAWPSPCSRSTAVCLPRTTRSCPCLLSLLLVSSFALCIPVFSVRPRPNLCPLGKSRIRCSRRSQAS